jgi:hypothetical protein
MKTKADMDPKTIGIAAVGIVGMAATTLADPYQIAGIAGLEKIGIAAVTVAILLYLLRQERAERQRLMEDYKELQAEVRREIQPALTAHGEAMREFGKALGRLADALDRRR